MKDGMVGTSDSTSRATEEAAEWSVLLLDGLGDRDLRRRFEEWRRRSTENAAAWVEIQQTAGLAAEVLPDYTHEWKPIVAARSGHATTAVRPRRWLVPALSVAFAAMVAWAAVPVILLRLQADHITGTAELRTLRLQDGSEITLAPDSALTVSYTAGARRVQLIQGEAFFSVVSDRERPFQVTAQSVHASVLGTRFDVRLDEGGVMVAVQEGRVLVESRDKGETLQAGQGVRVAGQGEFVRADLEPDAVAMWRQGLIYLRNRPLADAVKEIRRYFPGTIVVTNASLEKQLTTGVFNMADPEAALRGLAQAHGATVRRVSPWLLVVSGS